MQLSTESGQAHWNTLYGGVSNATSSPFGDALRWYSRNFNGGQYAPYVTVTYTLPSTGDVRHTMRIAASPRLAVQWVRR